jgi:hypothetical protein
MACESSSFGPKLKFAALAMIIGIVPARGAVPDQQIGAAAKVVNSVYGALESNQQTHWLRTGLDVFQNETIVTAENSASRVMFRDSTQLSIGPTAQVKLDRFVFDPNPAASAVAISFVKGVFRFSSGSLPKQNYSLHTPAATLAVRGTVFTVFVAPNGSELISVESGTVYVTCRRGLTVAVNAGQTTYISSPQGTAAPPTQSPPPPAVAQMDTLLR